MAAKLSKRWPVLTHYKRSSLERIALPLGGIGTGTVSLGGRGNLQDWEIMNRPAKGCTGAEAVFVLRAQPEDGEAVTRVIEGVLQPPYEGAFGETTLYHGLPRFRRCSFHAAYPLGQVWLSDPDVPVRVRLEAFNPLIPGDAEASGIPVAVLRYVLYNRLEVPVAVSVCGSITNVIGFDGKDGRAQGNVNAFRTGDRVRGLFLTSEGTEPGAPQYGTMALATTHDSVTVKRNWNPERRKGLLHLWDDLSQDGKLEDEEYPGLDQPKGSLAASLVLPPKGKGQVTFLLTWHFPNRQTWTPAKTEACAEGQGCCCAPNRVGNYYATLYQDAWDVAEQVAGRLDGLERTTCHFVEAFCSSSLPEVAKEAALYNISTLRSQTCFRTEDGRFFGWEGCCDDRGCCHGSCTHVWNYEQATAFLFGDLACSMRETEFLHATDDKGLMSFRVHLPLERAREWGVAAADGQMGCVMKAYRDWQLAGDNAMLEKLWPGIKRALSFCWIPGGWDENRDGVMEGCQHNTLDVEYYGPNPLMQGWYLGALRAGAEMARFMGDLDFAMTCRDLFEQGSAWTDAHLFNGEYYEQIVMPPSEGQLIADGLRAGMGAQELREPDYQVGAGCLVDQLVGQFMAHVCGLGYLLNKKNVRQTLKSLMAYNYHENLYGYFNHYRTFALNDESALVMCTFPRGNRPATPVHFYSEVMTGFEYAAGVHMLYEGQIKDGLRVISGIRARYDGKRRSPFDEAECGHHYARAMASWAAVLALTGFHYSAVKHTMAFAAQDGTFFWSNGYAWGTCKIKMGDGQATVKLSVLHGRLSLKQFVLTGYGECKLSTVKLIWAGETTPIDVRPGKADRA